MATFSNRDTIKAGIAAKMAANRDARAAAKANAREINSLQRRGVGPISAGPGPTLPYTTTFQGGATGGMGGGMGGARGSLTNDMMGGPISGPGAPLPAGGGGMPAPGTSGMPTAPLPPGATYKKGGKAKVKKMASGGMTSNSSPASKRADGIAQRGKTKCKIC